MFCWYKFSCSICTAEYVCECSSASSFAYTKPPPFSSHGSRIFLWLLFLWCRNQSWQWREVAALWWCLWWWQTKVDLPLPGVFQATVERLLKAWGLPEWETKGHAFCTVFAKGIAKSKQTFFEQLFQIVCISAHHFCFLQAFPLEDSFLHLQCHVFFALQGLSKQAKNTHDISCIWNWLHLLLCLLHISHVRRKWQLCTQHFYNNSI